MLSERQRIEAARTPTIDNYMPPPPPYEEVNGVYASHTPNGQTNSLDYFLGEVRNCYHDTLTCLLWTCCIPFRKPFNMLFQLLQVMHSYQAESDVELNLSIGDYVVVRKVCCLI